MTDGHYTNLIQGQCELMLKISRRLDEKGYAVIFHRLNQDGSHNKFLYKYFSGALTSLVNEASGRYPVFVHVIPHEHSQVGGLWTKHDLSPWREGEALSTPFTFSCKIMKRERLRVVHTTLSFVAGNDALKTKHKNDYASYKGDGRDGLELLLRTLEYPDCRAALCGVGRKLAA